MQYPARHRPPCACAADALARECTAALPIADCEAALRGRCVLRSGRLARGVRRPAGAPGRGDRRRPWLACRRLWQGHGMPRFGRWLALSVASRSSAAWRSTRRAGAARAQARGATTSGWPRPRDARLAAGTGFCSCVRRAAEHADSTARRESIELSALSGNLPHACAARLGRRAASSRASARKTDDVDYTAAVRDWLLALQQRIVDALEAARRRPFRTTPGPARRASGSTATGSRAARRRRAARARRLQLLATCAGRNCRRRPPSTGRSWPVRPSRRWACRWCSTRATRTCRRCT